MCIRDRGGNEDTDFFWRARAAGFVLATTGGAYLHHFGNVTQKALVTEQGSSRDETIGYFRAKWKLNWARRRWQQWRRKTRQAWWSWNERRCHGHTLREWHAAGKIFYR